MQYWNNDFNSGCHLNSGGNTGDAFTSVSATNRGFQMMVELQKDFCQKVNRRIPISLAYA